MFFSLGLGFGGLIALSSYNPINNNCHKDAMRVALVNFALSMLAGVVIFASLGFKANLGHAKCLIERDRQIDFYLADYNLKVLDYGAVFAQVPLSASPREDTKQEQDYLKQTSGEFVVSEAGERQNNNNNKRGKKKSRSIKIEEDDKGWPGEHEEALPTYDYNSEDAIASISNLDRQLDLGSSTGNFDYGDSDIEFVINASNLISRQQLDQIIENIPNLPTCSLDQELDEATQGSGLIFVVMAEALSEFNSGYDRFWLVLFYLMILTLGFDSQFGNLEGLLSSLMDLRWINRRCSRQLITGEFLFGLCRSTSPLWYHQQPSNLFIFSPSPPARPHLRPVAARLGRAVCTRGRKLPVGHL